MSGSPRQWQSVQALDRANMVRTNRARQKGAISRLPRKDGFERVAEILVEPPECCVNATPFELLMSVDRVGRHYARRWLNKARVPEHKRIGELTERQCRVLADLLRLSEGKLAA